MHIWVSLCQQKHAQIAKLIGPLPWKQSFSQNLAQGLATIVQGRRREMEGDKK